MAPSAYHSEHSTGNGGAPAVDLRLIDRSVEGLMPSTASSTDVTMPEGWPVRQPVELLYVRPSLVALGVALAILGLAGVAWVAIEVRSVRTAIETRALADERTRTLTGKDR